MWRTADSLPKQTVGSLAMTHAHCYVLQPSCLHVPCLHCLFWTHVLRQKVNFTDLCEPLHFLFCCSGCCLQPRFSSCCFLCVTLCCCRQGILQGSLLAGVQLAGFFQLLEKTAIPAVKWLFSIGSGGERMGIWPAALTACTLPGA